MLNFIDVHTHLTDKILYGNINEVYTGFKTLGVNFVCDCGCSLETSKKCKDNAEKFNEVYFMAGIHPDKANSFNLTELLKIEELACHKKCLGIGEIGLDYHYEGYDRTKQLDLFYNQLLLANKLNMPVVIHCRDACKDTVDMLKSNKHLLNNGFLMHCFSESLETAKELIKIGGYFSFGGTLTFKNSKRWEVLKEIPLERVLFETDAPYLAPTPFRGSINEPKNVVKVYEYASNILDISIDNLVYAIETNFKNLFKKFG